MTLKKIISEINTNNIPIGFYRLEEGRFPEFLVYLYTISDENERNKYNTLKNKESYVSESGKIFFPYSSIDVVKETYRQYDLISHDITTEKINSILNINSPSELYLAFSLYLILHEFGHWIHFEELEKKPYLWHQEDVHFKREYARKRNKAKYNPNLQKSYYVELNKEYNAIPMEKRANDYAENHLKKYFELLKKKL
ncbi:hypothetical protein SAMN02745120_0128 [Acetoanaerobium noterae]|uniref:Uncharacterized protein n=1 Tax=Acetoanaerobium noterae TaxID=745369 RepID=A0A1T5DSK3_9FIRM|nr:hypothetical protein [Acetoanaerobium noterae]SKB74641.1 hypothetical protein SAMN02745120_0128 [Acetoanaerobium noterae]